MVETDLSVSVFRPCGILIERGLVMLVLHFIKSFIHQEQQQDEVSFSQQFRYRSNTIQDEFLRFFRDSNSSSF